MRGDYYQSSGFFSGKLRHYFGAIRKQSPRLEPASSKEPLSLLLNQLLQDQNDGFFGAFGVSLASIVCRVLNWNGGLHGVKSGT